MSFGVDPRNPLEYARINYFLVPGVSYNREPISGVGGDYDFQVETIWRVGKAPNGDPPITGTEGDQWILTKKTGGYAQGNQNPTWQKFIPGGVASLFTLSDTANTVVDPSASGDVPPNNIQLYSSDGTIDIVSDAVNNRIDLIVNGGEAVHEFTTDVGGPVVDLAGVVAFTGATTTFTNGSVANTLRTEIQGTNHALFVGRGANTAAAFLGVGTNGQVLVGATGADPAFATLTSSDGSVTFTPGANTLSLQVTGGTSVGKTITGNTGGALSPTAGNWNIYGDTVAAGTTPIATSGSGSTLTVNAQRSQAIASADSTKVGLSNFSSNQFSVDSNAFVTLTGNNSSLPVFRATLAASTVGGVTGNGAAYTVAFDTADINQGSVFNTGTNTFTSAKAGYYLFTYTLCMEDLTAAMDTMKAHIKTIDITGPTTTNWRITEGNIGAMRAGTGNSFTASGSVIVYMDVGDTAQCTVIVSNGAGNTANVQGGPLTNFCGFLIA